MCTFIFLRFSDVYIHCPHLWNHLYWSETLSKSIPSPFVIGLLFSYCRNMYQYLYKGLSSWWKLWPSMSCMQILAILEAKKRTIKFHLIHYENGWELTTIIQYKKKHKWINDRKTERNWQRYSNTLYNMMHNANGNKRRCHCNTCNFWVIGNTILSPGYSNVKRMKYTFIEECINTLVHW